MVVEVGVGGQDRLAVPALLYDAGELLFYFMLFTNGNQYKILYITGNSKLIFPPPLGNHTSCM